MTQGITTFLEMFQVWFWVGFTVVLRVGAMMAVLPVFGEHSVPIKVKLALTFAFALIVAPATGQLIGDTPATSGLMLRYGGTEVLNGLFFGMMLRFFIMALQVAGTIAAQSTSLSQIFGGSVGVDPMPAIGNILVISGLALAVILGLHVHLAAFMISGYALIPPGTLPDASTVAEVGLTEVTRCVSLAFTLAAPFVIASLIYNITLGVINRAMPQLMVAFVGAPAITAGGLALLALSAPILLSIWSDRFFGFINAPFGPLP